MEQSSFWDDIIRKTLTIYANVIFALLWVGYALALIVNPDWLDLIWDWAQALPSLPKITVWVLFLPILVGLWIWESSWPVVGRLVGLAGILGWTLLAVNSWLRTFTSTVSFQR